MKYFILSLSLLLGTIANAHAALVANVKIDYTATPVTTTYVELIHSLPATVNKVDIFDSSGATLILAVGPSGSEVALPTYIFPGGGAVSDYIFSAGTRLSVKTESGTASAGVMLVNFLGVGY